MSVNVSWWSKHYIDFMNPLLRDHVYKDKEGKGEQRKTMLGRFALSGSLVHATKPERGSRQSQLYLDKMGSTFVICRGILLLKYFPKEVLDGALFQLSVGKYGLCHSINRQQTITVVVKWNGCYIWCVIFMWLLLHLLWNIYVHHFSQYLKWPVSLIKLRRVCGLCQCMAMDDDLKILMVHKEKTMVAQHRVLSKGHTRWQEAFECKKPDMRRHISAKHSRWTEHDSWKNSVPRCVCLLNVQMHISWTQHHLSFFCHLTSPEMLVNGLAWTCDDDYISLAGRETQIIASVWTLPDGHGMTAFTLHVFSWTLDDGKPKKHHHLTGDTRAIKDLFHHLDTAAAWLTSQLSPFVFTWRLMVENTPTIITWTWYQSDQGSYM